MINLCHRRVLVAVFFLGTLAACVSISGRLPLSVPSQPTGVFKAGAARVDITPMPGFPMGGYSAAGRISRGVWMRLQARAVCFEDPAGRSLALVSADLWAIPAGVADRVAELLPRDYQVRGIGREQIVLAATHTHNGPGNFSSSVLYNQLASPVGGFDPKLFDFITHRIASAIAAAWKSRVPAVLRYGEAPVFGLTRNRSLDAFLTNGIEAAALIEENRGRPIRTTSFRLGGEDAYRAVDPTLRVLRAEKAGEPGQFVAVLAFYAVHPTVMDTATEVYNSDIFGVAAASVERSLAALGPDGAEPVVAIFNGPEGDVQANWRRRDRTETITLGDVLADGIRGLLQDEGEEVTGGIAGRFGQAPLSDLATPISGAPTLCGADADWSFFRDAGFHEGMVQTDPALETKGQGMKRLPTEDEIPLKKARKAILLLVKHGLRPPKRVPIGVYRIGPVVMGTLPGEFTTILGRRIAADLKDESPGARHVWLIGLANEYMSYFTTEEEYDLQTYEGSSMMYGPHAGTRIRECLVALAKDIDGPPTRTKAVSYHYQAGPESRFGVKEFDLLAHRERLVVTHNALDNVLMDPVNGLPIPDDPRFVWIDKNPAWPPDPLRPEVVMPSVSIEVKDAEAWVPLKVGGAAETDAGPDFVTSVVASFWGESRWIAIWMPPDAVKTDPALSDAKFRFAVRGNGGVFHSPEFTWASAHKAWGLTGLAQKPDEPFPRTGNRR
jgi:neutral ceramidase